jgi:hypothetical protein
MEGSSFYVCPRGQGKTKSHVPQVTPGFCWRGDLSPFRGGMPQAWHESYWTKMFNATREGQINTWDYQKMFTVIERAAWRVIPLGTWSLI